MHNIKITHAISLMPHYSYQFLKGSWSKDVCDQNKEKHLLQILNTVNMYAEKYIELSTSMPIQMAQKTKKSKYLIHNIRPCDVPLLASNKHLFFLKRKMLKHKYADVTIQHKQNLNWQLKTNVTSNNHTELENRHTYSCKIINIKPKMYHKQPPSSLILKPAETHECPYCLNAYFLKYNLHWKISN